MKKITKILLVIGIIGLIVPKTFAQISVGLSISVGTPPPALPVYVQPACPTDGYLWQPGYWAYDDADGYYWVPGVWVAPPSPGLLWTPAYWGYSGGVYGFHQGYWGPHVGFYGGINYGFGYGGVGFGGGGWSGGHFRYNTAVVNVNTTVVHNTYIDRTVVNNTTINNNHYSFNGPGGSVAKPTAEDQRAMNEHHVQPTAAQLSHQHVASQDKNQFAKNNNGRPSATAMNKVGGRPFSTTGHAVSRSAFGHNQATGVKPADNKPQTADRPEQPERKEIAKPEQAERKENATPEQPEKKETPERTSTPAQHRQPQHVTTQANHTQAMHAQTQHVSQPHNNPQPHAMPHNNPRPAGGHGKHR